MWKQCLPITYLCLSFASDSYGPYLWDSTHNSSFCLDIQQSYKHVFIGLLQLSGADRSWPVPRILPTQPGAQESQTGEIYSLCNLVYFSTSQMCLISRLHIKAFPPQSRSYRNAVCLLYLFWVLLWDNVYEDIRHSFILFPVCDLSAGGSSTGAVSRGAEQPPTEWAKERRCYGSCQCLEQQTGIT